MDSEDLGFAPFETSEKLLLGVFFAIKTKAQAWWESQDQDVGATSNVSKMPDSQFWLVRFVKAAAAGSPCLFGDTWIRNFRVDEGGHADPRMGVNEVLIQDTPSRIGVTFVKV